jgi:hypothetical protein
VASSQPNSWRPLDKRLAERFASIEYVSYVFSHLVQGKKKKQWYETMQTDWETLFPEKADDRRILVYERPPPYQPVVKGGSKAKADGEVANKCVDTKKSM